LVDKKEALEKLQEAIQEAKQAPSIAIVETNTMTKTIMAISPSLDPSQKHVGDFEKHTSHIGLKLLK
jgi:hypothetical protein